MWIGSPQLPLVSVTTKAAYLGAARDAAGGAVADGGTGDREHPGLRGGVADRSARHLDRVPPAAVRLADHEGLEVPW